jgi:hypothetical protein
MADAIFIHAMWRTGSTYLWTKFREQVAYRAYYEPLNEALLYAGNVARTLPDPDQTRRRLRHPPLGRPYFDEYPLRAGGGLSGFDDRLPYSRYCLSAGDLDVPLSGYIGGLIAHARANEQIPVFQFNRSLLRSHWLRERFSGVHILVIRDPYDVWRSMRTQSLYFLAATCLILSENSAHPWIRPFARHWNPPSAGTHDLGKQFEYYESYAREAGNSLLPLFHAFYVYTIIHNAPIADVVIDMTQASSDASARAAMERALNASGIHFDLSDCELPAYDRLHDVDHVEAGTARFLASSFPDQVDRFRKLSFDDFSVCSRIARLFEPCGSRTPTR